MSETAMAAAFRKAGYNQRDIKMLCALAEFFNNGGSAEHLARLVAYAARQTLPGRGQDSHAHQGQMKASPSRQPVGEAEGQRGDAREGHMSVAPASPPVGGEGGHALDADKGLNPISSPPSPHADRTVNADKANVGVSASGAGAGHTRSAQRANEPMPAPRPQSASDKAAMKAVMSAHGMNSIYDIVISGTGRKLGDFTKFDLVQLKRRHVREVALIDSILSLPWPDKDKTRVREFVRVDELKRLYDASFKALETMNAA